MGEDLNNYFLTIDIEKAMKDLEKVETKRKETEKNTTETIAKIDDAQLKAFNRAVSAMQATWHGVETIARSMGVTFPKLMSTIISGAFTSIKLITSILVAQTFTPGMAAQAVLGLFQIGVSVAAAIAAEKEKKKAEEDLRNMNSVLGTVSGLIGAWSF